jgi:hypothetical protein
MKKAKKITKRSRANKRSSSKSSGKRGKAKQRALVPDPAAPESRHLIVDLPAGAGAADRKEAEHFVEVLDANKQLSRGSGALPPGATHQTEKDDSGNSRVVRKRYSSI